jgi:hypothetical protein
MELYQELYVEYLQQDNLNAIFLGKLPEEFGEYGIVTQNQAIMFRQFQINLEKLEDISEVRQNVVGDCASARMLNDNRKSMFETMRKEIGEFQAFVQELAS